MDVVVGQPGDSLPGAKEWWTAGVEVESLVYWVVEKEGRWTTDMVVG